MPDQLVTVGTYNSSFEAHLVKSELEAFEVDAMLDDDNVVSINWLLSIAIGGVKVRVAESDAADAIRILNTESAADES